MFESLSDRLGGVFDRLRGRGALTEADVRAAMREVRVALLEADVALPVARQFVDGVTEQAIGETLQAMLGSSRITSFVREGQEYDVILQAAADERAIPTDLTNLHVRSRSGALVPLASVVRLQEVWAFSILDSIALEMPTRSAISATDTPAATR